MVDTFDAVLDVQGEKLDVIIKRPRPEFREHTDVQEALLAWGQVQANLDHPDVVAVLEAGRDADGVYIIQEKVEGATLARLLKTLRRSHRTLTPANALLIAERTSSAVVGIHASAAGYHGDLQPREILIGYDGTVKVGGQRLTDLIAAAGLPPDPSEDHGYRSPELARRASRASSGRAASGAGARGAPGDGYAVALIILEMMLGHPVWQTSSMSVDDALRALVDLAPVAQGQPELAQSLYDLLQPWLQRQPSARPESFEAVAIGITQLMEDHGIRRNQEALGGFVELVVPPLEDADAPTRMAETPELDDDGALAVAPDRRAAFEAASVVITPEILAQAEAAYRKRAASERPVPPEPPPSAQTGAGRQTARRDARRALAVRRASPFGARRRGLRAASGAVGSAGGGGRDPQRGREGGGRRVRDRMGRMVAVRGRCRGDRARDDVGVFGGPGSNDPAAGHQRTIGRIGVRRQRAGR